MSDAREWPESWLETPDGKRYPITDSVVVGRSPDLLICLEDGERTVARRHCVLRRLPSGGVELEDLGSTNGTIVNGRKISREPLFDGDVMTLGTFRLTFHGQAAPPPAPPDELKQRVAEAPEVTERWLVWADALCERGDPRGEYLVSRPGPQSLGSQLDLLVRDHDLLLTWRLGHVATAQFFELTAEVLTALLSHPLVEFITELQLPTLGKWRTVLSAAPLPALRELRIGPLFSAQATSASADERSGGARRARVALAPQWQRHAAWPFTTDAGRLHHHVGRLALERATRRRDWQRDVHQRCQPLQSRLAPRRCHSHGPPHGDVLHRRAAALTTRHLTLRLNVRSGGAVGEGRVAVATR
jgi:FHA domain